MIFSVSQILFVRRTTWVLSTKHNFLDDVMQYSYIWDKKIPGRSPEKPRRRVPVWGVAVRHREGRASNPGSSEALWGGVFPATSSFEIRVWLWGNGETSHIQQSACAHVCVLSHVWLCDPVDHSPPGSSVHGTPQARVPEWAAMPASGGSSRAGTEPVSWGSCIGRLLTVCHLSHPPRMPPDQLGSRHGPARSTGVPSIRPSQQAVQPLNTSQDRKLTTWQGGCSLAAWFS